MLHQETSLVKGERKSYAGDGQRELYKEEETPDRDM